MDIGYVILLLLVLVYGSTAVLLHFRAGRGHRGPEEPTETRSEDPEDL